MKNYLFCIFLIVQIACVPTSNASRKEAVHEDQAQPIPVATLERERSRDLTPIDRMEIYGIALRVVHRELVDREVLPEFGYDQVLFYRTTTVQAQNPDALRASTTISQTAVASLMSRGQQEDLEENYGLIQPILPLKDGSEGVENLYKAAKRRDGQARAVVEFSSIGIDYSRSEAVVYVETYSEKSGILKFYLVLRMSSPPPDLYAGTFSGVESFEIIPVE